MSSVSLQQSAAFVKGYQSARDMTAWLGQGGQWIVAEGEGARPMMPAEEAGVVAFYQDYAGLHVRHHYESCKVCGGSGVWLRVEDGEPMTAVTCGRCGGCGYIATLEV